MYNTSMIISLAQTTLPGSSTELVSIVCITELPAGMELWIDYTIYTMEIAYTHCCSYSVFPQSVAKSANGYKKVFRYMYVT